MFRQAEWAMARLMDGVMLKNRKGTSELMAMSVLSEDIVTLVKLYAG